MVTKPSPTTIDEYIAAASPTSRPILEDIRQLVSSQFPQAQELISYQMPAFRLKRNFFYFAAFQKHIGIYPPLKDDAALIAELAPYRNEKGNLKFPLNQPMPYELIARLATALAAQYAS